MTIHYLSNRTGNPNIPQRLDAMDKAIRDMVEEVNKDLRGLPPARVSARITQRGYAAKPGEVVLCDPTGGGFVVILPSPTDPAVLGSWITVKNDSASANTISVAPASGTIDGQIQDLFAQARGVRRYAAIGGEWKSL